MDKTTLIDQLMKKPAEIYEAEVGLLEAQSKVQKAQYNLDTKKSELLQGTQIDGKNAETRTAQLHDLTMVERAEVVGAEREVSSARAILSRLQNELASLRAIARLLESEVA
jgi:hypothetical protein